MIQLTFKYIDFGLQIFFIVFGLFLFFIIGINAFNFYLLFGFWQFCLSIINFLFSKFNKSKVTLRRRSYVLLSFLTILLFGYFLFQLNQPNPYKHYILTGFVLLITSPILAIWYLTITLRELIDLQKAEKLKN